MHGGKHPLARLTHGMQGFPISHEPQGTEQNPLHQPMHVEEPHFIDASPRVLQMRNGHCRFQQLAAGHTGRKPDQTPPGLLLSLKGCRVGQHPLRAFQHKQVASQPIMVQQRIGTGNGSGKRHCGRPEQGFRLLEHGRRTPNLLLTGQHLSEGQSGIGQNHARHGVPGTIDSDAPV